MSSLWVPIRPGPPLGAICSRSCSTCPASCAKWRWTRWRVPRRPTSMGQMSLGKIDGFKHRWFNRSCGSMVRCPNLWEKWIDWLYMWFSWCYQREKDKSMWLVDVGVVYRSRQRGDMCCFCGGMWGKHICICLENHSFHVQKHINSLKEVGSKTNTWNNIVCKIV